jgi:hypothetical protein
MDPTTLVLVIALLLAVGAVLYLALKPEPPPPPQPSGIAGLLTAVLPIAGLFSGSGGGK